MDRLRGLDAFGVVSQGWQSLLVYVSKHQGRTTTWRACETQTEEFISPSARRKILLMTVRRARWKRQVKDMLG